MKNFIFNSLARENSFLGLKKSDKFLILMAILNPILYYINPILLIISIVVEMGVIFTEKELFHKKFWKGFLLAITYYGIGILKIKIYYWVFILSLPYIVFFVKNDLNKKKKMFLAVAAIFTFYLTIDLFIHKIKGYTISEYLRYVMCFIILYITMKTIKDFKELDEITDSFKVVAIVNIISGVIVAIFSLIKSLNFKCATNNHLYFVDIFRSTSHFRATAFFSDPNLYFAFFIFLLAIYEIVMFFKDEKNVKFFDLTNVLLMIAILISYSRTGIIAIAIYLITKFIAIKILKANETLNTIVWSTVIVFGVLIFGVFFKEVLDLLNWILYHLTLLIGRKSALIYSSSFTDSSRVKSWEVAIHSLKDHWMLGRGLNFWKEIYYMPPHNSFIMILQESGIIGLALFLGLIIYSFKRVPLYITICLIIIPMVTLDLQNFIMLFVFMAIGIIILKDKKNLKLNNAEGN